MRKGEYKESTYVISGKKGFEPLVPNKSTTVFETTPIDHPASFLISIAKLQYSPNMRKEMAKIICYPAPLVPPLLHSTVAQLRWETPHFFSSKAEE